MRILLALFILTTSCGYNHWKRTGYSKGWLTDSTDIDTQIVMSKEYKSDSSFFFNKDTIYLYGKDSVFITKYFYDRVNNKGYVATILPSRPEKTIITKTTTRTIEKKKWYDKYIDFILVILIILFIGLLYKIFRK